MGVAGVINEDHNRVWRRIGIWRRALWHTPRSYCGGPLDITDLGCFFKRGAPTCLNYTQAAQSGALLDPPPLPSPPFYK